MSAPNLTAGPPRTGEVGLRGLSRLLLARLVLAGFAFMLALALSPEGRTEGEELGLWAVLGFAFLSTALSGVLMNRVRRRAAFGAVQLGIDVAVVTALVHFSGGGVSAFGFLYLPITVFGAVLFDRRGAYGSALLCSLAFAVALASGGGRMPADTAFALWSAQTGALLIVALLASALARELRLTGERLDLSRARLSALRSLHERTVESLSSGLLTTDAERRITFFNPEAERITGRPAHEVLGCSLDDVLPGASELVPSAEAAHGRMRARLRVAGPDGEWRHLGIAVSILRGEGDTPERGPGDTPAVPGGAPGGYVTIFQDVTSVVQMEQELLRRERLAGVGELSASIAHEIRNPLAAISGSVELLRSGVSTPEDNARLMEIVLREIERLDALIRDFLLYARPAPPKLEPVALTPLLEEVGRMLATAVPVGTKLELEADPGAVVMADPTQLRQVLWNLVRNAVDALEGPGVVRVSASRVAAPAQGEEPGGRKPSTEGPDSVEIVVADTGRGIPLSELERIFDPFYTTKPEGTGLGLPTVHRIVEGHHGALSVESQPGVGTRFRVRLPLAGPAA